MSISSVRKSGPIYTDDGEVPWSVRMKQGVRF
jgi:hypothetical protein